MCLFGLYLLFSLMSHDPPHSLSHPRQRAPDQHRARAPAQHRHTSPPSDDGVAGARRTAVPPTPTPAARTAVDEEDGGSADGVGATTDATAVAQEV